MTRNNSRGPLRRPNVVALNVDQRQEIETGWGWFNPFHGSRELFQECWELHRDEVLVDWIKRHPGTRPFAWWFFDAIPKYGERLTTDQWTAEHEANRDYWTEHTWGVLHTHSVLQESEETYLRRHGLLTEAELRIRDDD